MVWGGGAPDRGGSREGKAKSLRNVKQQIADKLKAEKNAKPSGPSITTSPPAPCMLPCEHATPLVDCGLQLLNRQFDRDQVKVVARAAQEGVAVLLAYTNDWDKLDALVRLAKENQGAVYCLVGIHSNMIKGSSDKLSAARLEALRDAALRPEAVAVFAGLDFSRDIGIRFAQERALSAQMELAAQVGLPMVLYSVRAAEALADKITELRALPGGDSTPVAIFGFEGTAEELQVFVHELGCSVIVTGAVCAPGERGDALRAALRAVCPLPRLMVASDSPYATPQNIEDAFVREGRNEPSNLPHLLSVVAELYGQPSTASAACALHSNACTFFRLHTQQQQQQQQEAEDVPATGDALMQNGLPDAGAAASGNPMLAEDQPQGSPRQPAAAAAAATAAATAAASHSAAADCKVSPSPSDHPGAAPDLLRPTSSGTAASAATCPPAAATQLAPRAGLHDLEPSSAAAEPDSSAQPSSAACQPGPSGPAQAPPARHRPAAAKPAASAAATARSFLAQDQGEASEKLRDGSRPARVVYACRQCRSLLFSERDIQAHHVADAASQVTQFAHPSTSNARPGGGPGSRGGASSSLCSMFCLSPALPWLPASPHSPITTTPPQATPPSSSQPAPAAHSPVDGPGTSSGQSSEEESNDSDGGRGAGPSESGAPPKPKGRGGGRDAQRAQSQAEGRLLCPGCATKLGKWAVHGHVACACGVLVPAPTFCALRARLDVVDLQLDLAAAVRSNLVQYEDQQDGGDASDSDEWQGKKGKKTKKKASVKSNKTANFTSFRNKNWTVSTKPSSHISQPAAVLLEED